jgi:hypothetical protein
MAFWLYRKNKNGDGSTNYIQERRVQLAGSGLIQHASAAQVKRERGGWTIGGRDLVVAAGADPDSYAVVIDTAPRRPTLSLFEIRSVAGYSYAEWTPLMFTLEQLFADYAAPDTPAAMKREFNDSDCSRSVVRDFLYLTGGYERGTWNWGGNSRTTAVLLWGDAWDYFKKQAER